MIRKLGLFTKFVKRGYLNLLLKTKVKQLFVQILFVIILLTFALQYLTIKTDQEYLFEQYSNLFKTRDFVRYECKDVVNIGERFICLDGSLRMKQDKCVLITFGANKHDYSFEYELLEKQNCKTETFDPFNEPLKVQHQRIINFQEKSYTIEMSANWRFHRIGLTEHDTKAVNKYSIGWLDSFPNIIDFIGMSNKTIDLLKLDIAGVEWEFLRTLDIEYACKNIKQLIVDTHPLVKEKRTKHLGLIKKLEKCFLLFHRSSIFLQKDLVAERAEEEKRLLNVKGQRMGTKPVDSKSHKLHELTLYDNEIDIINHLFLYGRLYFVNKHFL